MSEKKSSSLSVEDIARLSGVSPATVSRVMNGYPHVKDKTRQKVLEVVQRYNFQPNPAARALASQSSRVLGILIPQLVGDVFSDAFFSLILQSITTQANELDYAVTLWLTAQLDPATIFQRALHETYSDGLIIAETSVNPMFLELLYQKNKPFMMIGRPRFREETTHYVDVKNQQGAYLMTQHLIALGRRRIGFIPGRDHVTASLDREAGYLQAMAEADLAPIVGPSGNYTDAGGYKAMVYLLHENVDAVFAANDAVAFGAIRAIHEKGRHVPDDIAVGGFDDLPQSATANPPLTTIRQPIEALGRAATRGLIHLLTRPDPSDDGNYPYVQEILDVELIQRASS